MQAKTFWDVFAKLIEMILTHYMEDFLPWDKSSEAKDISYFFLTAQSASSKIISMHAHFPKNDDISKKSC